MEASSSRIQDSLVATNHGRRFAILFVVLLMALIVPGFLEPGFVRSFVVPGFLTLALLSALAAVSGNKWTFRIGIVLAIPAVASAWFGAGLHNQPLEFAAEILTIAFFLHLSFTVLKDVFTKPIVDTESIAAALSVFMFLSYIFALVYALIYTLDPGALYVPDTIRAYQEQHPDSGQGIFGYFSIVTLTTLGYGDIAPVSPAARSAAMLEAVVGQLYLVSIVARLVGLHVASDRDVKTRVKS
jgi:hypothetical protein